MNKKFTDAKRRELKRIRQIIYRAKKKGYNFESLLKELPKLSTQTLKSLSPEKVRTRADYIPNFTDIVLKNIENLISEAEASTTQLYSRNAAHLSNVLRGEIQTFGRDKVAEALEQTPDDAIASAERAIYTSNDKEHREAVTNLIMLIQGAIPTIDESKAYTEWEEATDIYFENPFLK